MVRKDKKDAPTNEPANSPFNGVPDFETFKKSMDEEIDKQPKSRKTPKEETSAANDEFGFDLDELVKKIDAKIAELEADEKREKEEQERIQKEQQEKEKKEKPSSIEEVLVEKEVPKTEPVVSNKPAIDLDDDDDDDDFFDDFFDN